MNAKIEANTGLTLALITVIENETNSNSINHCCKYRKVIKVRII